MGSNYFKGEKENGPIRDDWREVDPIVEKG